MLQHVGEEVDDCQECTARPCCHHDVACRVPAAAPALTLDAPLPSLHRRRQLAEESLVLTLPG